LQPGLIITVQERRVLDEVKPRLSPTHMDPWSREEVNRTIAEVKRRSLVDPAFRTLALQNPAAAIARVNPKPLPATVRLKFTTEPTETGSSATGADISIQLPPIVENADELSDDELDQAAGGSTDIKFPDE